MRRSLILGVLSLGLVLVASGSVLAADNVSGLGSEVFPCPGQVVDLTFEGPGDVFVFDVTANINGGLKTTTSDCCIEGDVWRTTMVEAKAQSTGQTKSASGVVDDFQGVLTRGVATGDHLYKLLISYDKGVDIFPAGMSLCVEGAVTVIFLPGSSNP